MNFIVIFPDFSNISPKKLEISQNTIFIMKVVGKIWKIGFSNCCILNLLQVSFGNLTKNPGNRFKISGLKVGDEYFRQNFARKTKKYARSFA